MKFGRATLTVHETRAFSATVFDQFTPQPAVASDATSMSITFQRPAHIGDAIYRAEASADLRGWDELTLEVLNPGADPETVRATKTFIFAVR